MMAKLFMLSELSMPYAVVYYVNRNMAICFLLN